jgi:drug/metabolite transporter (DMT)-like permease
MVAATGSQRVIVLSILYGLLSILMVFVNKLILQSGSESGLVTPDSLLILQCAASAVLLVPLCLVLGQPMKLPLSDLGVCVVVNLAFVATMLANSYSLRYLSIQMVTLLKCCSVVVTALGDRLFYSQHINPLTWISLVLIVVGSAVGLVTDLQFSPVGYFWMILSIVFASSYVLVTKLLVSYRNIPFFTTVLWNNVLGTIFVLIYSVSASGMHPLHVFRVLSHILVGESETIYTTGWFVLFSGFVGLLLNISTFSLLGETSATSYVVVGAGKKIIQALLSHLVFGAPTGLLNLGSVMVGLTGATVYAYAKWDEKAVPKKREDGLPLAPDRDLMPDEILARVVEDQGRVSDVLHSQSKFPKVVEA